MRARIVQTILIALAVAMMSAVARADAWPDRPIRLVVPYPPGGGTDATARIVSAPIAQALGQPLVIENRPGASGLVGTDFVAASAPDGYTILMFADTNTIAPALYAKVMSDPVKDFAPIVQIAIGPLVIFANPTVPVNSIQELIEYARKQPGKLSYASPGNGSAQHMAMERLKLETGIKIQHVPYKGGGQAITDVIGGHVQLGVLGLSAVLPYIKSGKIKPLGITDLRRSALLPNVPTIAESAVPQFQAIQWFGIVAPAKTPPDIVAKLYSAFQKALKEPAVDQRLGELGLTVTPDRSTADFARFIRDDVARWPGIVKAVGVKLD